MGTNRGLQAIIDDERFLVDIRRAKDQKYHIGTKLDNGMNTIIDPAEYFKVGTYKGKDLYERRSEAKQ
jgi:hypothetical protein